MANITTIIDTILEKTTPVIKGTLKDENGAAIPAASLTTLTLTLYSMAGIKPIINARQDQNVLNTNNVTVDSNGLLTWSLQEADTAIQATTIVNLETHRAVFAWGYGTAKKGRYIIEHTIQNLEKVS